MIIAWLLIGAITFVGIALDVWRPGLWHRSDWWGLPLTMLALIVLGPSTYAIRWWYWRRGGRK